MSGVLELFKKRHEHLRNCYRDESGEYSDLSALVAIELAEELKKSGEDPNIIDIRGEPDLTSPFILQNETLRIKHCGGLALSAHAVCVSAGFVYDPMMPTPMPFGHYFDAAFEQSVQIKDATSLLER